MDGPWCGYIELVAHQTVYNVYLCDDNSTRAHGCHINSIMHNSQHIYSTPIPLLIFMARFSRFSIISIKARNNIYIYPKLAWCEEFEYNKFVDIPEWVCAASSGSITLFNY